MTPEQRQSEPNAQILIVDDNPDNRLLLASQLGMHGYDIIEADGGEQGLEKARQQQPDLILLDVMMPVMNGFEVCSHLKNDDRTIAIPVIMVTALRDIEYRIRGIEVGADEFLSRPHHREELLVRVRSLIRLKHARDRLEEERNRLQLLYNVTRATTNTQLDINQVMGEIITHTRAAVNATKGSIMLLNDAGEVTHKILIRAGLTPQKTEHVTQAVLQEGLAGWLIHHKRADIIADTKDDDRWIRLPDDTEYAGSVIGVPLIKDGDVIGVLILIHPEPQHFRYEHITLLETIAAQVTVAVHNAYLFNEISEQRRKLSAILAQSTDAIIITDEDKTIELINQSAEESFGLEADSVITNTIHDINGLSTLWPLFERAIEQPAAQEIHIFDGRILLASVTPISGIGYMAVMQDVTEMKRMEEMRLEEERRQKQLVKDTFARYMSPRLVDQVLSAEPGLLGQHQRRSAVVMFADLRGFTNMIVKLEPNVSISILNEFFTYMTNVVYKYDGTIFDLAGDELMIGFNAPIDQKDAGYRAVLTAVSMQRRFDELRQEWYQRTGAELGLGIGVDVGDVVMGNVGAETRMNFAMVGEAVNTAHRLVDIAKDGQIVISAEINGELDTHQQENGRTEELIDIQFESMGEVSLKGKPVPQLLYCGSLSRTQLT